MNVRFLFSFVATLAAVFCLLHSVAPAQEKSEKDWPTHLRVLTGPRGGQWFTMGKPIAEVLSRAVAPTTSRVGGGVANIDSLNKEAGDIGFSLTSFLGTSLSGEREYRHLKFDNATIMVNIYPQVLYVLLPKAVAEKYGITDAGSLLRLKAPLRFASLRPGTASEFILTLLLKHGYGMSYDDLRAQGWTLTFNNYAEIADNFASGDLDCFAYTAGTSVPLILTLETHADVVILPVEQAVLDKLSQKFRTTTYTIKPGDYKCVREPIKTLGDWTCLLVRRNLPEDMVYAINKALWEQRRVVSDIIRDFGGLSPDTALPEGIEAHPGSVRFWNSFK